MSAISSRSIRDMFSGLVDLKYSMRGVNISACPPKRVVGWAAIRNKGDDEFRVRL